MSSHPKNILGSSTPAGPELISKVDFTYKRKTISWVSQDLSFSIASLAWWVLWFHVFLLIILQTNKKKRRNLYIIENAFGIYFLVFTFQKKNLSKD